MTEVSLSSLETTAMKRLHSYSWLMVTSVLVFGSIMAQVQPKKDPIITFQLTLPQTSSVIYALRNSTLLDAKTANELADVLVVQANDTSFQKSFIVNTEKLTKKK